MTVTPFQFMSPLPGSNQRPTDSEKENSSPDLLLHGHP